jgi:diguanylate cyclase (GGDEF)-like protein
MPSDWIVLLEAAKAQSRVEMDGETLALLLEMLADARPVALHSADRYAVQVAVTAAGCQEALGSACARWLDAVRALGAPEWEIVRADVMTKAELDLEIELAGGDGGAGPGAFAHDASDRPATETAEAGIQDPVPAGHDLASELRWRLMLQDSRALVTLLSREGTVLLSVAPAETDVLLADDGSPIALADAVHPDDAAAVRDAVARVVAEPVETVAFTARLRHGDGWRWWESTARDLLDDPLVRAVVVSSQDVTERRLLEARLSELATHDELTGLVNRLVLLDELELAFAASEDGLLTAVFFVDIDDFRATVQRLGIPAGERVIVAVAERLSTTVCDGATAARLGSDEFALLCNGIAASAEAEEIAKRIADVLTEPIVVDDDEVRITVSIGVALGTSGMLRPATLLRHAEVAMHRARRGRARYEIFRRRRRSPTGAD